MKLDKDQIIFIDTYLKNSDISFIDIRMEMLDHIASEVENKMKNENLSFYEAFKSYMVVNKKKHLILYKKIVRNTDKKLVLQILKILGKPLTILILILILCFIILKLASFYFDISLVLKFFPFICLVGLGSYYYITTLLLGKNKRFSGIERISFVLIAFMQIHQFFYNPFYKNIIETTNLNLNIMAFSFSITMMIIIIQIIKKYKLEYTDLYKNMTA
ncbi:hypothetical protein KO500_05885 [Cellulophaga baltica]|uniref:hypothetical protein n=1 Tax=Cellulophaga TaxID=104264 RepID=UPI001C06587E|nr:MULTISPECIES: hypothetical protein [Cellulophaga]MBU2995952.1 hypothetical protein [Cellulophaga baltica]MDO6767347.1 hypothetical protein [Cellulophaga sp. 1_MG-2023]